jgi:hypothetical protein
MQARHSVISLAALARSIRRSSVVNNMSAPVARSFLYKAVAESLILVRGLWAGLVFDKLAAVAPSNADHRLALLAQPLGLGALGVALVVFGSSPTKSECAALARWRSRLVRPRSCSS